MGRRDDLGSVIHNACGSAPLAINGAGVPSISIGSPPCDQKYGISDFRAQPAGCDFFIGAFSTGRWASLGRCDWKVFEYVNVF